MVFLFERMALQKLVYLLGVVYKVPYGYQNLLCIRGSYCSELTDNLNNCVGGV